MSVYVVTTEKQWKAQYPGVSKYIPNGKQTPYPFEQDSTHFQWFSPNWTLCHGTVQGRPHAWVEIGQVVIDLAVRRKGSLIKRARLAFLSEMVMALENTLGHKKRQTVWEKKLEKFSHDKKQYYRKFKPAEVEKYDRNEACKMLDHFGRYGKWWGDPSPFAGVI